MHLQPWLAIDEVLSRFGDKRGKARRRYREFIEEGLDSKKLRNFSGGGLIRSYDGWETLSRMRNEHERCLGDERVPGDSQFVASAISQDQLDIKPSSLGQMQGWNLDKLIEAVRRYCDLSEAQLLEKARSNRLSLTIALIY